MNNQSERNMKIFKLGAEWRSDNMEIVRVILLSSSMPVCGLAAIDFALCPTASSNCGTEIVRMSEW